MQNQHLQLDPQRLFSARSLTLDDSSSIDLPDEIVRELQQSIMEIDSATSRDRQSAR